MEFRKNSLYIFYILVVVGALSSGALINSCKTSDNSYKLTGDVIKDGQNLVQLKCTGCHQLVPVNALTQPVWMNHILPSMAKYLHVSVYGGSQYFKSDPLDTTGISLPNWLAIVAYYKKVAPAELIAAKKPAPYINDWAGFTLKKPREANTEVYTSMVSYNPELHKIYSSDALTLKLYEWGQNLAPQAVAEMPHLL